MLLDSFKTRGYNPWSPRTPPKQTGYGALIPPLPVSCGRGVSGTVQAFVRSSRPACAPQRSEANSIAREVDWKQESIFFLKVRWIRTAIERARLPTTLYLEASKIHTHSHSQRQLCAGSSSREADAIIGRALCGYCESASSPWQWSTKLATDSSCVFFQALIPGNLGKSSQPI